MYHTLIMFFWNYYTCRLFQAAASLMYISCVRLTNFVFEMVGFFVCVFCFLQYFYWSLYGQASLCINRYNQLYELLVLILLYSGNNAHVQNLVLARVETQFVCVINLLFICYFTILFVLTIHSHALYRQSCRLLNVLLMATVLGSVKSGTLLVSMYISKLSYTLIFSSHYLLCLYVYRLSCRPMKCSSGRLFQAAFKVQVDICLRGTTFCYCKFCWSIH